LSSDVLPQIVPDQNPFGFLTLIPRTVVVVSHERNSASAVTDDVIDELDILHNRPWSIAVLIAYREQHGKSGLGLLPTVFHHVALDDDAAGIFQLEQVLDGPLCAFVSRLVLLPSQGFHQVIPSHYNVRPHEILDVRIAAAEHDVLTGPLQVVVADFERTGAPPAENRLGVSSDLLKVGEVRVDDGQVPPVQGHAPPRPLFRITVEGATVDNDRVRQCRDRPFSVRAEPQQGVEITAFGWRKLDADEPVMMCASLREHHALPLPGNE